MCEGGRQGIRERGPASVHPINEESPVSPSRNASTAADLDLAKATARGDHGAFETLMRRYNGRLFRIARAILKDDSEAEDALQEAYILAYRNIGDYRADAQLGTW